MQEKHQAKTEELLCSVYVSVSVLCVVQCLIHQTVKTRSNEKALFAQ